MTFGTIAAVLAGAILPSISLVMGNVAAAFSGNSNVDPSGNSSILQTMSVIAAVVSMIALSLFVFTYMSYAFW